MPQKKLFLLCFLALAGAPLARAAAAPVDPTVPFATSNQSPLVAIYGLPPAGPATVLTPGKLAVALRADIASMCSRDDRGGESILLDGESYRFTLSLKQGLGESFEAGLEIPYVMHRQGFLDNFISEWHDFFHLPQGDRATLPSDQLTYRYINMQGRTEIDLQNETEGLGDLRLSAAWQLWRREGNVPQALALRTSLKLPTGDEDNLLGSGSTDLALWLSGAQALGDDSLALFGAAGTLLMSEGGVLTEQQRHAVAFGTLGLGWRPFPFLAVKAQIDGHSAFYTASNLRELSDSLQLALGGTLGLSDTLALDLAVTEDIVVATAPDVVFHLALRQAF